MFLIPSVALGLLLALVLGGNPSRLAAVRFRIASAVAASLLIQVVLFSRLGSSIDSHLRSVLHLASYGLLAAFALANLRLRALLPVFLGMALNGIAITANGGSMPLSRAAARAAGLSTVNGGTNVSVNAHKLWFLGDVFALPPQLPLANVFSVGDLLIGLGMISFIILSSTGGSTSGREKTVDWTRLVQPFRVPTYRRLAAGKLVSSMGDWLTLVALVGWVYQTTGSTQNVATLLVIRLAPPIIGGSLAAVIVDRVKKQRLLPWVEVLRGLLIAGALAGVLGDERLIVYAALACSGALAAISSATIPTLMPSLLPPDQLASANAGLAVAKDSAMALGALAAGIALSFVGVSVALAADLLTFALAAALFGTLRITTTPREPRADQPRTSGIRYLLAKRSLLLLTFSFAAATLATGITNATLPRLLAGFGFGAGGYGYGIGALAAGLVLGQVLVGFVCIGAAAGRWIGAALIAMAGLFALLGLVQHGPTALLVLVGIGLVDGTTDVVFQTIVQREADPRHLGAVFGFSSALYTATMLGAVALAPLVNTLVQASNVILGASLFLIVAGGTALLGQPTRAAQPTPALRFPEQI